MKCQVALYSAAGGPRKTELRNKVLSVASPAPQTPIHPEDQPPPSKSKGMESRSQDKALFPVLMSEETPKCFHPQEVCFSCPHTPSQPSLGGDPKATSWSLGHGKAAESFV